MSATAVARPSGRHAAQAIPGVEQYRWFILLGLITAAVMEVLDTTIINVALPQMAGNLSATQEEIAWVSTSYILANVVVLPMTAFFTARFGRKRYLTFSIVLFIVASFLCGTSSSLGELVFFRLLQGAGGAALLSTAQATLRQIFPAREQGLVQAIFLLGIIVAPTLGPTLGGWITDNYTWSWCFFINVPIGVASTLLVSTFLHDAPNAQRHTGDIDWLGIGLLIAGVGSLQYVLEEGNSHDWFSDAWIVRLSILSAVSLATLLWWQLSSRNKHPVIELRVLKNRQLSASIFLFIVLGFGLYGGAILFPLFTQTILGFTPTATGLSMMPGGIATACVALFCGFMLNGDKPKADARVLILVGMALMLWAMWDLGHLTTVAGERDARMALIIRGLSLGFLFTPINNVAFGSLKPHEAQQASGLINLSRQLGGSFGIAVLTTYLTRHIAFHRADLVTNLYPGNPAFEQRYQALVGGMLAKGGSLIDARTQALKILEGSLMKQAAMLAYNDAWMFILLSFLCVIPAVFILRRPKGRVAVDAH
ncbi:drug resistance transporter, EmrB/QacA subfamily [Gemmatirosa kalamazoonensis]|uniref:Drug resistance transporter, EmrB/QacA subfamily n=1 Tax=Gemmatirosa kalamazoonensis TaxID=861299 RepID=W0RHR8_9BACT|nr:DHA2 family efflux MFS transporter permease subunit [Gemmatirosa kalamazoonensis]AHG89972.1 drug resistance transporter, EmrB/QacA subfamily [Gemmatirosa kalamazoonensis]